MGSPFLEASFNSIAWVCERDRTAVLAHESRPSGVRFSGTVLSVFTLRAARNPARDPVAVIVVFVVKVIVGGPSGAEVPGWAAFSTPLTLPVAHGVHRLVLNDSDAIDAHRQISVEGDYDLNLSMWLRRPTAMLLKPAFPGASIAMSRSWGTDGWHCRWRYRRGRQAAVSAPCREPWIYDPTRRAWRSSR